MWQAAAVDRQRRTTEGVDVSQSLQIRNFAKGRTECETQLKYLTHDVVSANRCMKIETLHYCRDREGDGRAGGVSGVRCVSVCVLRVSLRCAFVSVRDYSCSACRCVVCAAMLGIFAQGCLLKMLGQLYAVFPRLSAGRS